MLKVDKKTICDLCELPTGTKPSKPGGIHEECWDEYIKWRETLESGIPADQHITEPEAQLPEKQPFIAEVTSDDPTFEVGETVVGV